MERPMVWGRRIKGRIIERPMASTSIQWGRRWEQRSNGPGLEVERILLTFHWEKLNHLASTYSKGGWEMWSLAGSLLPRSISVTQKGNTGVTAGHLWGTAIQGRVREREKTGDPRQNDVSCDERGTRTKRVSRTSVREGEWKHNKATK